MLAGLTVVVTAAAMGIGHERLEFNLLVSSARDPARLTMVGNVRMLILALCCTRDSPETGAIYGMTERASHPKVLCTPQATTGFRYNDGPTTIRSGPCSFGFQVNLLTRLKQLIRVDPTFYLAARRLRCHTCHTGSSKGRTWL